MIAIISILAGMLLPALNKAREAAYSATCMSNLKQLRMVWEFYFADYDNICPGPSFTDKNGDPSKWFIIAAYYAGYTEAMTYDEYVDKVYIPQNNRIMRCPADKTKWKHPTSGYYYMPNYGLNGVYELDSSNKYGMDKRKIARVRNPLEVIFLGDCYTNGYEYGYRICNVQPGLWNSETVDAVTRHPGRTANFIFVDGHCKSKNYDYILNEVSLGINSIFFDRTQKY